MQIERNATEIKLSEVVSAFSYALDMTEGQPEGHAVRSCLLGMRLADEIGLPADQRSALFYALLLKDVGCSSNSAKVCYLFGADDRTAKRELKTVDWTSTFRSVGYLLKNVAPAGSMYERACRFFGLAAGGQRQARQLVQMRCERGATIARMLALPAESAMAIRALDEHWDGGGHPDGLKGTQIPLLARVMSLAQTAEVFASEYGLRTALEMARKRSGTWFDPHLVTAFLSLERETAFWEKLRQGDPQRFVASIEPEDQVILADEQRLDQIAQAFAEVIDAKSPWTYRHSAGVAEIATGLAKVLGMPPADVRETWRAALVHDVGKLGISNMILDKPGRLTADEMTEVRRHPAYTQRILERVAGFKGLAELAGAHHERLDGNGYHRGVPGPHLSQQARILAVADMYEALASKRPYRADLSEGEVLDILTKQVGTGICPRVFDALKTYLNQSAYAPVRIAA